MIDKRTEVKEIASALRNIASALKDIASSIGVLAFVVVIHGCVS